MVFLEIVSVAGTGRSLPFLFVGFSAVGLEAVGLPGGTLVWAL